MCIRDRNPLEYDLSEMMDNEEIQEMARDVEALRKELYEAAGRNLSNAGGHVECKGQGSSDPDAPCVELQISSSFGQTCIIFG